MNHSTPPPLSPLSHPTTPLNGVARLSHWGIIRLTGEDAAKFIHSQLSQDFVLLGQDMARLAAFCSAKGRMQASFIGFKHADGEILLLCSHDILSATLKRLSMFVLRAKVRLSDATDELAIYGLAGDAVKTIAAPAYSAWSRSDSDTQTLIHLYPADQTPRQLLIAPASAPPPAGAELALPIWLWGEVRSGVAMLSAAVVDAFVPQMLNYESVGGVNFKKGCYPGQEVVARSQFRGTLKRRAFLVHAEAAMAAGDAIFASGDADQPVATVVQAAPAPQGGFDAIISAQLVAVEGGALHLGQCDGPILQVLPLPYRLLEDV
ncbi:MAG: folate-binding protein YgfZ [Rhodoferax sp.]|nr:folate-binding protein YgfZ [Rhodoferax sp.]